MVSFQNVRWTFAAVILLTVSVQWISSKAVYIGRERHPTTDNDARENSDIPAGGTSGVVGSGYDEHLLQTQFQSYAADGFQKHLKFLKTPKPEIVANIKRRIRARMKGRKVDQSNERNLWTSHPKNLEWPGPDTDEVVGVIKSLGI